MVVFDNGDETHTKLEAFLTLTRVNKYLIINYYTAHTNEINQKISRKKMMYLLSMILSTIYRLLFQAVLTETPLLRIQTTQFYSLFEETETLAFKV